MLNTLTLRLSQLLLSFSLLLYLISRSLEFYNDIKLPELKTLVFCQKLFDESTVNMVTSLIKFELIYSPHVFDQPNTN